MAMAMEVAVIHKYRLSREGSLFAAFVVLRSRTLSLRLFFPPRPGLCHIDLGRTRAVRPSVRGTARRFDQPVKLCGAAAFMLVVPCKDSMKWMATSAYCGMLRRHFQLGKLLMLGVKIRFRNDN